MDTSPDTSQDRVDLVTAAARLGLSLEAVRKRVQRRQLAAHKVDGRWYVVLDRASYGTNGSEAGQDAVQDRVQDPSRSRPTDGTARELVDVLRGEVEHLRRELAIRNEELQRKDAIIMALAQSRPALAAGVPTQVDSKTLEEPTEPRLSTAPWWRRWWPWSGAG